MDYLVGDIICHFLPLETVIVWNQVNKQIHDCTKQYLENKSKELICVYWSYDRYAENAPYVYANKPINGQHFKTCFLMTKKAYYDAVELHRHRVKTKMKTQIKTMFPPRGGRSAVRDRMPHLHNMLANIKKMRKFVEQLEQIKV
jgi:hypothetical protein